MKRNEEVKILVVEDDPFFSRVLQKRLSVEGYKVQSAADGRQGMKLIVSFEPDLVISDWMMPEVDGLELCQSVKTGLGEAAPYFILLTAKGEIDNRLLGLQTGADDYLVKPCDQAELMARVRAGLRIVLLSQQLRQTVNELRLANAELEAARSLQQPTLEQLPACSVCKKIRDEAGNWQRIDAYLVAKGLAEFTHGVCPTCRAEHYPNVPDSDRKAQG